MRCASRARSCSVSRATGAPAARAYGGLRADILDPGRMGVRRRAAGACVTRAPRGGCALTTNQGVALMPKYLWKASYSVRGAKGVASGGGERAARGRRPRHQGPGRQARGVLLRVRRSPTPLRARRHLPRRARLQPRSRWQSTARRAPAFETVVLVKRRRSTPPARSRSSFTPAGG